jgi:hypothetical protein
MCSACIQPKNVDHIFFCCVLTQFLWSGHVRCDLKPNQHTRWISILDGFNWNETHYLYPIFAQCWSLWTIRNKFTIKKKLLHQTAHLVPQQNPRPCYYWTRSWYLNFASPTPSRRRMILLSFSPKTMCLTLMYISWSKLYSWLASAVCVLFCKLVFLA